MTAIQQRIPLHESECRDVVLTALNQVMPAVGFLIGGVVTVGELTPGRICDLSCRNCRSCSQRSCSARSIACD